MSIADNVHAAPRRPQNTLPILALISLSSLLIREPFVGPIQYTLSTYSLQIMWYLPDLLTATTTALFLLECFRKQETSIVVLFLIIALYAAIGLVVTSSISAVGSACKALLPLFVGFSIRRNDLIDNRYGYPLFVILAAATAGVIWSTSNPLPWAGLRFEGVNRISEFKQTVWAYGGGIRPFGFSGDQHAAASSILTLTLLVSLGASDRVRRIAIVIGFIGIYLTTSRTALISLGMLVLITEAKDRSIFYRTLLWAACAAPLLSILITIAATNISSLDVPQQLYTLWLRGAVSWTEPFSYIDRITEYAIIHGTGLGGVGFPLLQTDLRTYYTPIDNFFLYNYLTFGLVYVPVYVVLAKHALNCDDKLVVVAFCTASVFGSTILGWADYLFMVVLGVGCKCILSQTPKRSDKHMERVHLKDKLGSAIRGIQ